MRAQRRSPRQVPHDTRPVGRLDCGHWWGSPGALQLCGGVLERCACSHLPSALTGSSSSGACRASGQVPYWSTPPGAVSTARIVTPWDCQRTT
jgi:hypothetical protein